jgi:hypothetical protein
MKLPLFEYPSFRYKIKDWDFKKKALLGKMKEENFNRSLLQSFETDRQKDGKSYIHYLRDLLSPELNEFCREAQVTCSMTDAWFVRYQKDDQQTVHNHRGWGFSGVIYLEYDSNVHTPTFFVAPWQDPSTDTTSISVPTDVEEGDMIIFPSYTLHFIKPNKSKKRRTVLSFDLLPETPELRRDK